MVEILLALGVVAIGICSVMVLFPVGANAGRDASMETYAADLAEQTLHLAKFNLNKLGKINWATYIENDSDYQQCIQSLGSYSQSSSFLGKIQTFFNSALPEEINVESFAYNFEDTIENHKALKVQSDEGFSPFVCAKTTSSASVSMAMGVLDIYLPIHMDPRAR